MKFGEEDITELLNNMQPVLNSGAYVFVSVNDGSVVNRNDAICEFKEAEGTTIIIEKSKAEALGLNFSHVFSWITLRVHSSLAAIGLTARFSTALAQQNISCNVVAGFYHDHIFVKAQDAAKAIEVLTVLSKSNQTL